jgi:hypothetical protein
MQPVVVMGYGSVFCFGHIDLIVHQRRHPGTLSQHLCLIAENNAQGQRGISPAVTWYLVTILFVVCFGKYLAFYFLS